MPTIAFVAAVLVWAGYHHVSPQQGGGHAVARSSSGGGGAGAASETLSLGPIALPAGSLPATTSANATAHLAALEDSRTLQFDLCNGFTNQRIALLSGAGRARSSLVGSERASNLSGPVQPPVLPHLDLFGQHPHGRLPARSTDARRAPPPQAWCWRRS